MSGLIGNAIAAILGVSHPTAASASAVAPSAPPATSGGGGGGGKKAGYVGRVTDAGIVGSARAFARFRISDLPGAVTAARLEIMYLNKATPTADVALIEVADFGTLDPSDWGLTERATINTSAITPATSENTKVSLDVTTRYNQAKTDGLSHFALKLQYGNEAEGVGPGRWYQVGLTGSWAPTLVLTITAGQDARLAILATRVAIDLARSDELGRRAAVVTAGDGSTYPPLGDDVRLAATIDGCVDDGSGTYTGTPGAVIAKGADRILYLFRHPTEGSGLTAGQVDAASFATARARLADWFDLAGGVTQVLDVREWAARFARGCRAIVYTDQDGRESLYVEPLGGTGADPVRLVRPWEHGALRLSPVLSADGATFPVSRAEVFYAQDLLGLTAGGWDGHALISADETDPADAVRQAQAVDAEARYGVRGPGDQATSASPESAYEDVPLDTPGTPTGLRLLQWLWDRTQSRPRPAQRLEVDLPRCALGWRLMDEFDLESYAFPSGAARLLPTVAPMQGATETGADAYQARRGRFQVRELPRLTGESGSEFPVQVVAQLLAWETV